MDDGGGVVMGWGGEGRRVWRGDGCQDSRSGSKVTRSFFWEMDSGTTGLRGIKTVPSFNMAVMDTYSVDASLLLGQITFSVKVRSRTWKINQSYDIRFVKLFSM